MRCLEHMAEWGKLHSIAKERWETGDDDMKQQIARIAAASAWGLGQWDSMEEYVCVIPRQSLEGAWYRAVLATYQDQYHLAQQCIDKARDLIDTELTALSGESYNRAYNAMVQVQMLTELEEAIQYKLVPERRPAIELMWWNRLHVSNNCVISCIFAIVLTRHTSKRIRIFKRLFSCINLFRVANNQ